MAPEPAAQPPLVTLAQIRAAAATLKGVAAHTPLLPFGPPDRQHYLKAESLQPIGAFKIRGAYVALASLSAAERARGVITYSSGNHAQGVARAARLLGAPAVVDGERAARDQLDGHRFEEAWRHEAGMRPSDLAGIWRLTQLMRRG